jgi:hypothetical protein
MLSRIVLAGCFAIGVASIACGGETVSSVTDADATDGGLMDATASGLDDPANWSTFNLLPQSPATHYSGTAFDGRYVYFAPRYDADAVVQCDTLGDFTASSSWHVLEVGKLVPVGTGFAGAAFDGRYVYFAPNSSPFGFGDASPPRGLVLRYDTTVDFGSLSSWSTFDLTIAGATARSFVGVTFDGRYLYFVPNGDSTPSGAVVQYDTHADFAAPSSWASFDTATVDPTAIKFAGAVFDGRYITFMPNGQAGSTFTRYDTKAPFGSAKSWSAFKFLAVSEFFGAAFDGRYIYPVSARGDIMVRYDTQGDFGSRLGSWSDVTITTIDPGAKSFAGAAFDGRYIYYVPGASTNLLRYDTQYPFNQLSSWSSFDIGTVDSAASEFGGATFNGRYLYFATGGGTLIPRLDTRRMPPTLPPGPAHGSFY